MHTITKKTTIERIGAKSKVSKKCTISHTFEVPVGVGVKAASKPKNTSKGLGSERTYHRLLNEVRNDISHLNKDQNHCNLVDIATENTELMLSTFIKNDELQAECNRLRKENEELKKREEDRLKNGIFQNNQNKKRKIIKDIIA